MTRRDTNPFLTITSTGGLLPVPLLERLTTSPDDLKGTRPADYQLLPGKQLRDIINRSWNDLQGVWHSYRTHLDTLHDDDPATRATLERWVLPLLRELGFDTVHPANNTGRLYVDESALTDGRREWPITHEWGDRVPLHLLGANVPLDRRTPGVHGAANASPHSNVQDFLNASDRHLWAIVTNGRHLRILRDSTSLTRQAYLEFDLHTMFDNDVFVDFTLLWMLAHRTRFEGPSPADCWLETWQNTAHEQGVRALTELQNGVRAAIEAFGTGLLEHPANTDLRQALRSGDLDRQDYYRQLLRLVYRLVFLFVIEDRDLLHPPDTDPAVRRRYADNYSTARLRDQAHTHGGGRHPDAWQQLNVLFNGIANPNGIPALGLPTLTGGLFDPAWTDALTGTQMTNRRLYTAVRNLGYVRRDNVLHRIDYRNLGAEELGSVYESLLAMHPDIDPDARTVRLDTAAGNERRTTGAYYTPRSLIARVLDDALDPVIERAIHGKTPADAEQALLQLTVCDPAMGSAHFLVGAAHRLAKHLATIRTGDIEPDPSAVQQALRDVVSRCIYGVDINPMAVELAKVSLWLECHVAGQPLTFLDHHLRCGNALLGVGFDRNLIRWNPDDRNDPGGVPNAAFTALGGAHKPTAEEKAAAKTLRDRNRTRREGQLNLLTTGITHDDPTSQLAKRALGIAYMDDSTADSLHEKANAWMVYGDTEELRREKLRADAWTATWTIPKTTQQTKQDDLPFDVYYDTHFNGLPADTRPGVQQSRTEADRHRYFHWYIEYPDIAERGGFDCLVGNPPWERVKLQTEEWFAEQGRDDIADAANSAARTRLINALYDSDDPVDRHLGDEWDQALRRSAVHSELYRKSGRYPHGGVGDVNLYALFANHFLDSHNRDGAAGFICPDGLATGATYAPFFGSLVTHGRLRSFWSFENEDKLFPEVHNETKFALVTFDHGDPARPIGFVGYVRQADQIDDPTRRYQLTADDIAAINPNTLTAPLFRLAGSAEVTAAIHRHQPVLISDGDEVAGIPAANPWSVRFLSMFHMANDSNLFLSRNGLPDDARAERQANVYEQPDGSRYLPLYEGKMLWHYDHRYGTYDGQTQKQANKGVLPHTTADQKSDPKFTVQPRYWVPAHLVRDALDARDWDRDWVIAFRDVGPKERTFLPAVIPAYAAGNKAPLLLLREATHAPLLVACLSAFVVDYAVRQKTSSGIGLFVVKQAPVLPPEAARQPLPWDPHDTVDSFITPRVAELVYTSYDLYDFANDISDLDRPYHDFNHEPYRWDDRRRPVLQAELDALMFHLYGLDRHQTEWVLDSFDVLAKYEQRDHGEYRTKRLVLERYDSMTEAISTNGAYTCPLDHEPASPALVHEPEWVDVE